MNRLWINTFRNLIHNIYIYVVMRFRYFVWILLLTAGTALNGQYTKEFKRIFFDADYLMETGFYEEAFNRYKNLLTLDPGNYNILFHCGACCLNIPGNARCAPSPFTVMKVRHSGAVITRTALPGLKSRFYTLPPREPWT